MTTAFSHPNVPTPPTPPKAEADPLLGRLGRFHIAAELLYDCPSEISVVLEDCVVVHAQHSFARRAIEYTAFHPSFEPLSHNIEPPYYDLCWEETEEQTAAGPLPVREFKGFAPAVIT